MESAWDKGLRRTFGLQYAPLPLCPSLLLYFSPSLRLRLPHTVHSLSAAAQPDSTPIRGQTSAKGHSSHFGFRAVHRRRPWWIIRWLNSIHSFLGS